MPHAALTYFLHLLSHFGEGPAPVLLPKKVSRTHVVGLLLPSGDSGLRWGGLRRHRRPAEPEPEHVVHEGVVRPAVLDLWGKVKVSVKEHQKGTVEAPPVLGRAEGIPPLAQVPAQVGVEDGLGVGDVGENNGRRICDSGCHRHGVNRLQNE